MIRDRTLEARRKLVSKLPITGKIVRGSLLKRVVRHSKGCPKCARGPGLRSDGELSRRAHAPVQRAPRASSRNTPMAEQLPGAEGGDRGDLRAQPSSAASG